MKLKITTQEVRDLIEAGFASAALRTALEFGLFRFLQDQPRTPQAVSEQFNVPLTRCRYWLQYLGDMGFLRQVKKGYQTSRKAKAAILDAYSDDVWALLAVEGRERLTVVEDLQDRIHDPGSVLAARGLVRGDYVDEMTRDPNRARHFTRMLFELHQTLAPEVAAALDLNGVSRLMDVGGGSGVISMALVRKYPDLEATVVDIRTVCEAGEEIASEQGLAGRVRYHAANFVQDPLPTGFDVVMECDVGVYSVELFRKFAASLNTGGRCIIIDQVAPAEGVAPPTRIHWAFERSLVNPDFRFETATNLADKLKAAGMRIRSERQLTEDRIIEAVK